MRAGLFCTLLLVGVVVSATSTADFAQWMTAHGRSYASPIELARREAWFHANAAEVQRLRLEQPLARFALNDFADRSPAELAAMRMPMRAVPAVPASKLWQPTGAPLPTSWDWRNHSVVTPVKNQGSAGTCWAFSTTEAIESAYAINGNPLTEFSVEQIVDCDASDCGVFGGWPYLAYQYVMDNGLTTEANYPYCCGGLPNITTCYPCNANPNKTFCGPPAPNCKRHCLYKNSSRDVVIENWLAIPANETAIMEALVTLGPLSVLLDATSLNFYDGGIWDPWFCSNTAVDHAVQLVGYGVEEGVFESTPYWLLRNSWGESFGLAGYWKMIRKSADQCGLFTYVTVPQGVKPSA